MIKKIIKFIKNRYREIIIFIILFAIIITLSSSVLYEKNSKISNSFMDIFLKVPKTIKKVENTSEKEIFIDEKDKKILDLEKENAKLRKEVIDSKLKNEELKTLENLKGVLNVIDDKYDPKPITASIIAKNEGKYYEIFTITAGRNDGVTMNSIALNEKGLIGRVYEVSDNYSKIISIMDNNASCSFEVVEVPSERGILSQTLHLSHDKTYMEGKLNGYLFNIDSPVKKGDTIVTSGMGLYPESIPIGKVVNIIKDTQNLVKYLQIEPYVDFQNMDMVTILNPREVE